MPHSQVDPEACRARAVTSKTEDGNIGAAVRIFCSDDTPPEFSEKTYEELKTKHTAVSPSSIKQHPTPDGSFPAHQFVEAEVLKVIRSFPAGSAAGSDGLRPQHLLDMALSPDAGQNLLTAVTSFVSMLFRGVCHND